MLVQGVAENQVRAAVRPQAFDIIVLVDNAGRSTPASSTLWGSLTVVESPGFPEPDQIAVTAAFGGDGEAFWTEPVGPSITPHPTS